MFFKCICIIMNVNCFIYFFLNLLIEWFNKIDKNECCFLKRFLKLNNLMNMLGVFILNKRNDIIVNINNFLN